MAARPGVQPMRRVHLWLVNAALWIVLAESVASIFSGGVEASLFPNVYCIVVLAALIVSICTLPVVYLAVNRLGALKAGRLPLRIASALLLALPHLYVLSEVLPGTGLVVVVIAAAAAVCAGAGFLVGRRAELFASWGLASLLGSALPLLLLHRTYYTVRIDPHEFNMYFFFAFGIATTAPVLAVMIYDILRAAAGRRIHLAEATASLVSGTAVGYVFLGLVPEFSGEFVSFVVVLSVLAFVLGMTRLGPIRRARYSVPVFAVAIGIQMFLLASPDGATKYRWTLATRTLIAGKLLQGTPIGRIIYRDASVRGAHIPGSDVVALARGWNASAGVSHKYGDYSVLLITVDTMRYRSTGYSGMAPEGVTPNIDRLAEGSLRFHDVYTQGGWTSLAVPALLWSKYPNRIGFEPLFEVKENLNLYLEGEIPGGAKIWQCYQAPTAEKASNVAEVLVRHGYRTIAVINDGATQYFEPRFGFSRGFQEVIYPSSKEQREKFKTTRRLKGMPLDDVLADRAVARIEELGDEKFFMWIHFYAPHGGRPPEEDGKRFGQYHGLIHFSDAQLGRVLDALERTGKSARTIIAVSADHGRNVDERKAPSHGSTLFEETTRIPLVIHVPGEKPADIREQAGLIDIVPTLLSYLGVGIPSDMQGFTLRPIIEKRNVARRPPVFVETWRREVKAEAMRLHLVAVVDGHYKLIHDKLSDAYSLFHLERDPAEHGNLLAGELTDADNENYRRLRRLLDEWPEPVFTRRDR